MISERSQPVAAGKWPTDHIMKGASSQLPSSPNTDGYPLHHYKRESGKKVSGNCHQGAYQPKLAEVKKPTPPKRSEYFTTTLFQTRRRARQRHAEARALWLT